MWKTFGLQFAAQAPHSSEAPDEAKLDLIRSDLAGLRREVRSIRRATRPVISAHGMVIEPDGDPPSPEELDEFGRYVAETLSDLPPGAMIFQPPNRLTIRPDKTVEMAVMIMIERRASQIGLALNWENDNRRVGGEAHIELRGQA